MPLTTPEIVSGAALLLAIISAVWQRFGVILDIKKDIATTTLTFQKEVSAFQNQLLTCKANSVSNLTVAKDTIIAQLTTQINVLSGQTIALGGQLTLVDTRVVKQEMKMDLFWTAVQDTVKNMIKQPIHFRKDDLLDRFPSLENGEMNELKGILQGEKRELLSNIKKIEPDKKTYLLAIVLMLAGIDSILIDRR